MRRRDLIAGLGAAGWPLAGWAQPAERVQRIGVIFAVGENNGWQPYSSPYTQALADLGWTDGRNVRMDLRWSRNDGNWRRALAQELVGLQPDIILAVGNLLTAALQRETRTIPIVFVSVSDAVGSGLVARLNRPSGNITGFALSEPPLGGKWLQLLLEIAPRLKRAAIMFNPDNGIANSFVPSFETAARSLKVVPMIAHVRGDVEIETSIIDLGREPGGGLVVGPDLFMFAHSMPIILTAARNNVPAVYPDSVFATNGGLLSYGLDRLDPWRRAAPYVDRILRGEKPGDLPVQFSNKFVMVINLKTAKAIGLTIPPNVLAVADEVIE
jgi:putative ABC transport system substrate-binding protein